MSPSSGNLEQGAQSGDRALRERARQIYRLNFCSHEGILDEGDDWADYQRYNPSASERQEWKDEFFTQCLDGLDGSELEYLESAAWLMSSLSFDALPKMTLLSGKGDSYTKLFYSLSLFRLAKAAGKMTALPEDRSQAISAATAIWRGLATDPISISSENRSKIQSSHLVALEASTSEVYIRNYATKLLRQNSATYKVSQLMIFIAMLLFLLWIFWG